MSKFINPFTDWGFKRLFGQEFSKDLLISFLNDLFEGEFLIKDVTFKDKEQLAETKDLRGCIFDVYCVTDDGKKIIVEMQNNRVPLFVNRTLYYSSKSIVSQRDKGSTKKNPMLYELVPVYTVCFMNFVPEDTDEVKKFKTDVMLREKNSEVAFSDKLRFIYLSLPLFKKSEKQCESDFEKWIYVLKHMEALERMPFTAQKKIFKRLAEIADSSNLSQTEREKYEESRKVADDWYSSMYGRWISGVKEGESRTKQKIAANLLTMGLSNDAIAQATGLSLEQILKLKN